MTEGKEFFGKLLREVGKELTKNIKKAEEENEESKKQQDFIVEKLSVGMVLECKIPSMDFVNKGISHYIKLGGDISRNNILTQLTKEVARLEKIKDPDEILKMIMKKDEHEQEVLEIVKSHIKSPIIFPPFSTS